MRRARARRVEEVPVAGHLVRALEPPAEGAPPLVVEERRAATAARQASLLETEDEGDVEASRARPHEVEHGHAPGLPRGGPTYGGALERRHERLGGDLLPERRELAEQPERRVVGAQILARVIADRRRLESVGGAKHRLEEPARSVERRLGGPQLVHHRQRGPAEPLGLFLDPRRRVDRAAAEPPLDEVDARPRETREG